MYGSYNIKNKIPFFFYYMREKIRHNHNLHKRKTSSNNVSNPKLNIWDSLTILWVFSRDLDHLFGPALSSSMHMSSRSQTTSLLCGWCFWGYHMASIFSNLVKPTISTGLSLDTQACHIFANLTCSS